VSFERTARANLANGPRPASGRLASRAAWICSCVLTSGSDVFECSLALATCRLCRLASLLSIDPQYNILRALHGGDTGRNPLAPNAMEKWEHRIIPAPEVGLVWIPLGSDAQWGPQFGVGALQISHGTTCRGAFALEVGSSTPKNHCHRAPIQHAT